MSWMAPAKVSLNQRLGNWTWFPAARIVAD
jgi:hypothetical protein